MEGCAIPYTAAHFSVTPPLQLRASAVRPTQHSLLDKAGYREPTNLKK